MRRNDPQRPSSTIQQTGQPVASAQDLRKEEAELRNYTKNLGRVSDVLSLIGQIPENKGKDVVAKKPPTKQSSGPDHTYVNESPDLPSRPPPKLDSPKHGKKDKKAKDKQDKASDKDKKADKKKKKDIAIGNYDSLEFSGGDAIYEEMQPIAPYCSLDGTSISSGSGSGEYLEPVQRSVASSSLDSMSIDDVCDVLKRLELGQHKKKFKKEKISGLLLKRFDEKVLMDDFSFRRVDAIKLLTYVETGHIPK